MRNPILLAVSLLLVGACRDSSGPESPPRPRFLRARVSSPPVATPTISFWAKTNESREASIVYHARPGAIDSTTLLTVRVPSGSLSQRPNGAAFGAVDSVLITISVVDPSRLLVQMEPSGLRFSSAVPAQLMMSYAEEDFDFDGDGDVDAADADIEMHLAIWRQPTATAPWTKLGSTVYTTSEQVVTSITQFSNYIVAY